MTGLSPSAYTLVGLTALVAGLVTILVYAFVRFGAAIRDVRRQVREGNQERAFVSAALQDAIAKLREQERAMTVRAESSERLNSEIVSSLASGLLVVGLKGDVRMLNPAGRRLLRVAELPRAGRFRDVLSAAGPLADVVEECLSSARPIVRRALAIRQGDGSSMHLGVTVSPLCDELGSPQGAICLFSDLTAVVDLEDQLRLKDSLARLGELTAGLAHEFRNGLATIHGYTRLIDMSRVAPEYGPYIQAMRDETDALGQVVTNFLNFAKPVQLSLASVDVGEVVTRVVDEVRPEAEKLDGTVRVCGTFSTVMGDEVLLRQAFTNLVRNAVEACRDAAGTRPEVVVDGTIDAQGLLRVTVSDNGPGVDPAIREKIFRPFFTGKSAGTGLGLALVQKIVVTHNGRVQVGDSDAGGAAFQVFLPTVSRD